jgi:hypothetical protein
MNPKLLMNFTQRVENGTESEQNDTISFIDVLSELIQTIQLPLNVYTINIMPLQPLRIKVEKKENWPS